MLDLYLETGDGGAHPDFCRFSAKQIRELMAHRAKAAWGIARIDQGQALLASLFYNAHRAQGKPAIAVEDLMTAEKPPTNWNQVRARMGGRPE